MRIPSRFSPVGESLPYPQSAIPSPHLGTGSLWSFSSWTSWSALKPSLQHQPHRASFSLFRSYSWMWGLAQVWTSRFSFGKSWTLGWDVTRAADAQLVTADGHRAPGPSSSLCLQPSRTGDQHHCHFSSEKRKAKETKRLTQGHAATTRRNWSTLGWGSSRALPCLSEIRRGGWVCTVSVHEHGDWYLPLPK